MNNALKGMALKEKFKIGANRVIEMKNIKNAMSTLHGVYKLRKDQEILSAVRSANLGVEEEMKQINDITREGGFMEDSLLHNDALHSAKSSEIERNFGDVALLTIQKQRERNRELNQKKIANAIANAGKITPKEREHYKAMVECYDVMQARLERREQMIRGNAWGHLHLDTMIRAAGHAQGKSIDDSGHAMSNTEASRKKVASVLEQVNQLQTALAEGENNLVLQLQDQLDVLHREFARQGQMMEIMQQKMNHQVNHLQEVTAIYQR